jgi:hypothetical protein
MPSVVELLRSRSRAIVLAALAVGVAGCSADTSRFDKSFASRGAPGEVTGSVPPAQAAPVGRVGSTQLAPPSKPPRLALRNRRRRRGRGLASYHPAPAASPRSPDRCRRRSRASQRQRQARNGPGTAARPSGRPGRDHRQHRPPSRRADIRHPAGQRHDRARDPLPGPAAGDPTPSASLPASVLPRARARRPAIRLPAAKPASVTAGGMPVQPAPAQPACTSRGGRHAEQDFAPLQQAGQRDCQGQQHPAAGNAQYRRPHCHSRRAHIERQGQ